MVPHNVSDLRLGDDRLRRVTFSIRANRGPVGGMVPGPVAF